MQGMALKSTCFTIVNGITDGAVFGIAIMYAFFPNSPYLMFVIASFIELRLVQSIVYGIGSSSPGGLTPVKLALAGAAISALLGQFIWNRIVFQSCPRGEYVECRRSRWSEMAKY